jgi:hypothetical protein
MQAWARPGRARRRCRTMSWPPRSCTAFQKSVTSTACMRTRCLACGGAGGGRSGPGWAGARHAGRAPMRAHAGVGRGSIGGGSPETRGSHLSRTPRRPAAARRPRRPRPAPPPPSPGQLRRVDRCHLLLGWGCQPWPACAEATRDARAPGPLGSQRCERRELKLARSRLHVAALRAQGTPTGHREAAAHPSPPPPPQIQLPCTDDQPPRPRCPAPAAPASLPEFPTSSTTRHASLHTPHDDPVPACELAATIPTAAHAHPPASQPPSAPLLTSC